MVCQSRRTPRKKIDSKQNIAMEFVEPWVNVWMREPGSSSIADDYSCTLFTEYTSLFSLGAPVPAFLPTEEAEHA